MTDYNYAAELFRCLDASGIAYLVKPLLLSLVKLSVLGLKCAFYLLYYDNYRVTGLTLAFETPTARLSNSCAPESSQ